MTVSRNLNLSGFRSNFTPFRLHRNAIGRLLGGLTFFVAAALLVSTSAAQETETKPALVPGSEVSLSAIKAADWIQGEGPTAFEPGKVYIFECWATWCPPCIGLIPHVNELHKKYYDKGLRVHGMSWENDKDLVKKFVEERGEGMSYPVALAVEGSSFETEYLTAAGVESIPHAFVIRNGKLLLGTDASRLTDSLIEMVLSGDEGATKAAAIIKAAHDNQGKAEALYSQFLKAGTPDAMAAKLKELETLDSGYYQIPQMKLDLLMRRQDWSAVATGLMEMPNSQSKTSFLTTTARKVATNGADKYSMELVKAIATKYSEYVDDGGKRIGPNHFAYLSIIQWMAEDKDAAANYADKGVEVAMNYARATEARTNAFKRFAESVKEGTMPTMSDLSKWQREGKAKAAK